MHLQKVLLIEKNLGVRKLLSSILRHNGYLVEVADSTESGIRTALKEHPALILLELDLPDENSIEAINSLTSDPSTRDIPVVAYTERADKAAMNESLHRGAARVLTIPVTAGELLKVLHSCLSPPPTIADHQRAVSAYRCS